ncbi:general secretion pathway protein G [Oxalobacteraceae bacterium GrIS 2.11]
MSGTVIRNCEAIKRPGCAPGFTLIELLITLAILGLMATIALPVTRTVMQREKEKELRYDLREIRSAIDAYKKAYDDGRIQNSVGNSGYPKSLVAMVNGVVDLKSASGKAMHFLRRMPRDPMNPDLSLTPEESWGKRCYTSDSESPTEGADVFDVYSKSTEVGLNGAAYDKW